jgi:hypothetical protein
MLVLLDKMMGKVSDVSHRSNYVQVGKRDKHGRK